MKIRMGFVSNSSSASFSIKLDDITNNQLKLIQNHIEVVNDDYCPKGHKCPYNTGQWCDKHDAWDITVVDGKVKGFTTMNNFDMEKFLEGIGIDKNKMKFQYD